MAGEPKIFTSSLFRDCNQMIWQNWKIVSLHYMPCSGMSWQKNGSILWIVTSSHCDYFLIMSTSQKTNLKSKWIFRIFTHLHSEKTGSCVWKNTPWLWFIFPIKWGKIIWLVGTSYRFSTWSWHYNLYLLGCNLQTGSFISNKSCPNYTS